MELVKSQSKRGERWWPHPMERTRLLVRGAAPLLGTQSFLSSSRKSAPFTARHRQRKWKIPEHPEALSVSKGTLPPEPLPSSGTGQGLCMQAGSGREVASSVARGYGQHCPCLPRRGEAPRADLPALTMSQSENSSGAPPGPPGPQPQAEQQSDGFSEKLLISTLLALHSWMMREGFQCLL